MRRFVPAIELLTRAVVAIDGSKMEAVMRSFMVLRVHYALDAAAAFEG